MTTIKEARILDLAARMFDVPDGLMIDVTGYSVAEVDEARRRVLADRECIAEGRKDDAGKARIDLIAPEFLFETAAVLEFGAAKYSERNWERGMSWGRCFGALMRHMWAWWGGEQKDAETGLSHLAHAACCLMFLMAYEKRAAGADDRPNSS